MRHVERKVKLLVSNDMGISIDNHYGTSRSTRKQHNVILRTHRRQRLRAGNAHYLFGNSADRDPSRQPQRPPATRQLRSMKT